MSDQPKPTGEWKEWTGKRITNFLTQRSAKELAEEINAALAAEQEEHGRITANLAMQVQEVTHQLTTVRELRECDQKALAAEREKSRILGNMTDGFREQRQVLMDAIQAHKELACCDSYDMFDAALAKVKS